MDNKVEEITILMVEDDSGHAALIERNLRRAGIMNELKYFDNGQKVVDYLFGTGQGESSQKHSAMLMLLDLNLPELDGFQVLQKVKADERTKLIPIIILTTTDNPKEIERCYQLGCNVYVSKPVEYEDFAESIRKLGLMLAIVKVP